MRKIAFYFIFLLALEISYVYIILDFRRNGKHRNDILTKMAKTYYQILNVDARAGFAELKRAYYRQAKRCHPDLFGNSPEKTREFQLLALAFDVLTDAGKRGNTTAASSPTTNFSGATPRDRLNR